MSENEFLDGISNVDPDIVERFISMDNKLQKKSTQKRVWPRQSVIAACFALAYCFLVAVSILVQNSLWRIGLPDVPVWNDTRYSAQDIGALFDLTFLESGATNAYTKVCVPDAKYLYIDSMAEQEYLPIYQRNDEGIPIDKEAFQSLMDNILFNLCVSSEISPPPYEIKEWKLNSFDMDIAFEAEMDIDTKVDSYRLHAFQSNTHYSIFLDPGSYNDWILTLDGETVQIDQRLTDEEIITSLQSAKEKLFNIFNVSFPDTKIIREFGSYSKYGVEYINIFFYDESAHPLNSGSDYPMSDFIKITFDNTHHGEPSDSVLLYADVHFRKYRIDSSEHYVFSENVKRISLEDAEALLYNGYVFGGYSCPLCMATQEKVNFKGYDFVDIEYVFGSFPGNRKEAMGIPFYSFYKEIGTSKNGNTIYVKTYVPAIEVSGYVEYFNSQGNRHSYRNVFTP